MSLETSPSSERRVLSGNDFLDVLRSSGLLSSEQLRTLIPELQAAASAAAATIAEDSVDVYLRELKLRNLLTPWQAENLLTDKPQVSVLGRYRLLDEIGRGGMGRVFLAEHTLMRRKVAIKVVSRSEDRETRIDRFLQESRAAASLDHDHLVRVYHLDQEDSSYYLVMEHVDGEDLKKRGDRLGPLEFRQAADYVRQAALGLAHMHQQGLVHRDVKPSNLLVDRKDCVKVLDLGLVRFTAEGGAGLTGECRLLGTTDFIAPEQVRDSRQVDHRADLYGLGGVLYYLLAGQAPFADAPLFDRLNKHLHEQPESLLLRRPDAPAELVEICERLLSKRPEDRPASADETARLLETWLNSDRSGSALSPAPAFLTDGSQIGVTLDQPSDSGALSIAADAEKRDALARFAGGVAHRLNNMLQIVEESVSLAQMDAQRAAEVDWNEIHSAIRAAGDLSDRLLIVAGRGAFVSEPCPLDALLNEVVNSFAPPASVEIRRDIPKELPRVLGDAKQLRRMLTNVLTNAREALPDTGGTVTLSARSPAEPSRNEVEIVIRDNGAGMDAATERRMFDPFYSTRTPERGLGLAVAQGIAVQHGGRIAVETRAGLGTAVRITLPVMAPPARPATEGQPGRKTVLVADDEDRIRDLTQRLLKRFGFDVLTAKDGVEAVELYRRQHERIDLVLLDQWMPRLSGEMALEQMRGVHSGVRAILWSGCADQSILRRLRRKGEISFIQKPYKADVLVEEVNRLLAPAAAN